jgi:putative ABC transport system substrate-binding protein
MRRRQFLGLVGGAAAWPVAARSQSGPPMRRIGVLIAATEGDPEFQARMVLMRDVLRKLGWVDGRNIRIVYRWAVDAVLTATYAKYLVDLQPDLLLATSTPSTRAFQQLTHTIPIVFVNLTEPVGQGFVEGLSHPGGNLTGTANFEFSIAGKWLGILKELVPSITQASFLFNPATAPSPEVFFRLTESLAASIGVEMKPAPVVNSGEIERVIWSLADSSSRGLIVHTDISNANNRDLIIGLAARHRVPAIYAQGFYPRRGGLVSYGVNPFERYQTGAAYIDRILRGAKPEDLPVDQPTKFEFVINLKTAQALGLTVPLPLLVAADEVIE